MYLIVLQSNPQDASSYEQGLEIAMTLCDFEKSVEIIVEGDFLKCCLEESDAVFIKKTRQLELFEIPLFSPENLKCLNSNVVSYEVLREKYESAEGILVF